MLVQGRRVTGTQVEGYRCRGIGLLVEGHRVTGTQVEGYRCRGIGLLVEEQDSWRREMWLLVAEHRITGRETGLLAEGYMVTG